MRIQIPMAVNTKILSYRMYAMQPGRRVKKFWETAHSHIRVLPWRCIKLIHPKRRSLSVSLDGVTSQYIATCNSLFCLFVRNSVRRSCTKLLANLGTTRSTSLSAEERLFAVSNFLGAVQDCRNVIRCSERLSRLEKSPTRATYILRASLL
jgi:hypothetical protein